MSEYKIDSLIEGIERCKGSIKIFEDAIEKERKTIKEYYFMIETIERKERQSKASVIKIDIKGDSTQEGKIDLK